MISVLDSEKQTALVTGGSRGIGKACAIALARDGFQVILTYVSKPEEAKKTVEHILAHGGNAAAVALDSDDPHSIEDFFADQIKEKINLYALVNNAGITKDSLLLRMKDEQFEKVLNVNLRGAFIFSREAAKIMTRKRAGRIVNISSVVGQMGNPGQANYSAAKAGLIGLTKACAKELAARNITVNAIAPGFVETDMTADIDGKLLETYVNAIPLGRLGKAEDIADAVSFLVSLKASYITGQVLAVNGGMYC